MMSRSILISMVVLFLLISACGSSATPTVSAEKVGNQISIAGGSYIDVSAAELQTMLVNKDFTLVNVHISFEGNIGETDLSIPYDQVAQNLDRLPDKDAKIVLYCRSDRMSTMAAETLVGLGYTHIWNLSGGMAAWEQAGLQIDR